MSLIEETSDTNDKGYDKMLIEKHLCNVVFKKEESNYFTISFVTENFLLIKHNITS